MTIETAFSISPQVQRGLYPFAVQKFLQKQLSDFKQFEEQENINRSVDLYYSRLLDRAIEKNLITKGQAEKFLIDELNFGRLRNLYIYLLQDTSHLEDIEEVKKSINALSRFYNVDKTFNGFPFIYNLNAKTERGDTGLVHADIELDEDGKVSNILLLFSKGIFADGQEMNYYTGIEINVELKMLIIKLRDKLDEWNYEAKMHKVQLLFKQNIANCFSLSTPLATSRIQKLIYAMTSDLTNKVLTPVTSKVNEVLETSVTQQISNWNQAILEDSVEITQADYEGVKNAILNNYYRLYMQNIVGKIDSKDLVEKYKVSGYLRTVKFVDDTIGEGKAKSSDSKESLLDTSIYYDIKTRLDQSKTIKFSTIYWVDIPNTKERVGTTFHIEPSGRFRCNMLPNYFNKEMCDYVLRKIAKYLPEY